MGQDSSAHLNDIGPREVSIDWKMAKGETGHLVGRVGGGALSRGFGKSKDLDSEVKNDWGSGRGDHWDNLALFRLVSDLWS